MRSGAHVKYQINWLSNTIRIPRFQKVLNFISPFRYNFLISFFSPFQLRRTLLVCKPLLQATCPVESVSKPMLKRKQHPRRGNKNSKTKLFSKKESRKGCQFHLKLGSYYGWLIILHHVHKTGFSQPYLLANMHTYRNVGTIEIFLLLLK